MNVLTSNGMPIPFDDVHFAPLSESSAALHDPAELRRRFRADGYLFLRRLIDAEEVHELRAAYFAQFDPSYLKAGTTPREGIFSGFVPAKLPPHGTVGHPAHAFVRSELFERFLSNERLHGIASVLLGGDVEILPRRIVRHFCYASRTSSRAHADHDYLSHGTRDLLTMWIPTGDCPLRTGGLVYLEQSDRIPPAMLTPLRDVTDRPGDRRPISHDLAHVATALRRRWLWADYEAGDVALHSPRMVHASLDNSTEAMRLSIDVRFVRRGDAIDPRWQKAWSGDDGN